MEGINLKNFQRMVLSGLVLFLVSMGIQAHAADNDAATGPGKQRILTVITARQQNILVTHDHQFKLAEMIRIMDIDGKPVCYFQIPVPVEAEILYTPVPSEAPVVPKQYPTAIEIVIQKQLMAPQPE